MIPWMLIVIWGIFFAVKITTNNSRAICLIFCTTLLPLHYLKYRLCFTIADFYVVHAA